MFDTRIDSKKFGKVQGKKMKEEQSAGGERESGGGRLEAEKGSRDKGKGRGRNRENGEGRAGGSPQMGRREPESAIGKRLAQCCPICATSEKNCVLGYPICL